MDIDKLSKKDLFKILNRTYRLIDTALFDKEFDTHVDRKFITWLRKCYQH